MRIRNTLQTILGMKERAWRALIASLQGSCLLLLVSLFCLFSYEESAQLQTLRLSSVFLELSQLMFLCAALLPVCLEDLLPPDRKRPPGSSGR